MRVEVAICVFAHEYASSEHSHLDICILTHDADLQNTVRADGNGRREAGERLNVIALAGRDVAVDVCHGGLRILRLRDARGDAALEAGAQGHFDFDVLQAVRSWREGAVGDSERSSDHQQRTP